MKVWGLGPLKGFLNDHKTVKRGKLGKVIASSTGTLTVQMGKRLFLLSVESDISNLKAGDTIRFWADPDSAPADHLRARVVASFDLEENSLIIGERNDAKLRIPIPRNMEPAMVHRIGERLQLVLDKLDERSLRAFERFLMFADLPRLLNASPSEIKRLCEAFKILTASTPDEINAVVHGGNYVITDSAGFKVQGIGPLKILKSTIDICMKAKESPKHLQVSIIEKSADIDTVVARIFDEIREKGIRNLEIFPGLILRKTDARIEIFLFTAATYFNRLMNILEPLLGKTTTILEHDVGNALIFQPAGTQTGKFAPHEDFISTAVQNGIAPKILIGIGEKEIWVFGAGEHAVTMVVNTGKTPSHNILVFTRTMPFSELEREGSNIAIFIKNNGLRMVKGNSPLMKVEGFISPDHVHEIENVLRERNEIILIRRHITTKNRQLHRPPNQLYRVISRVLLPGVSRRIGKEKQKMRFKGKYRIENASKKEWMKLLETLNEKLRGSSERLEVEKMINRFLPDSVRFFWLKRLADGEVYIDERDLDTPHGRRKLYAILLALKTREYGEVEGWIHVHEKAVNIVAKIEKNSNRAKTMVPKLMRRLEELGFDIVDVRLATRRKELISPVPSREGFEIYG